MITIITGVPGSGKSLRAVEIIDSAVQSGREVYSDIAGLAIQGVKEAPRDWQECPDGALVVHDEAHEHYPGTGKAGRADDARVLALNTHRHRGIDLVFVTQASTMLHHDIRKLASEHIHVQRMFGTAQASVFRWQRAANENDRNERQLADTQVWRYPKPLFKAYRSATIHTAVRRLPRKVLAAIVVGAAFVVGAAYMLLTNDFLYAENAGDVVAPAADKPSSVQPPKRQNAAAVAEGEPASFGRPSSGDGVLSDLFRFAASTEVPPVSGCVYTDNRCMCYARSGRALDLTFRECRAAADRPLPVQIAVGNSRSARRDVETGE